MSAWDTYEERIAAHGGSKLGAAYNREVRMIYKKLPENLSFQTVDIYLSDYGYNIDSPSMAEHKIQKKVAIINSDNLDEKTIISFPKDDLELGSLIYWMDNYWLLSERDANTTLYTRGKLLQCNHLLKWINDDLELIKQWCVVADGTKYMSGEYEDRHYILTRGDSRISVRIAKNAETSRLDRENRFLIDDEDSPHKLSYILSKPVKKGFTYNGKGIFSFVMQEVTATNYDNHELGIADYYRYFPNGMDAEGTGSSAGSEQPGSSETETNETGSTGETSAETGTTGSESTETGNGRKVWI